MGEVTAPGWLAGSSGVSASVGAAAAGRGHGLCRGHRQLGRGHRNGAADPDGQVAGFGVSARSTSSSVRSFSRNSSARALMKATSSSCQIARYSSRSSLLSSTSLAEPSNTMPPGVEDHRAVGQLSARTRSARR
jgi:hypothetical protein